MAYCGAYRHMEKTYLTLRMTDENLLLYIEQHKTPEFWDRFKYDPNRVAYVRRWGCVLRRAARHRGLL